VRGEASRQSLELRVVDPSLRPIPQSGVLGADSRFALRVAVQTPAFLYVFRHAPGQPPSPVWSAETAIRPEAPLLLPQNGEWFSPAPGASEELFQFVASVEPLSPERVSEALASAPPPREPEVTTTKNRDPGLILSAQLASKAPIVLSVRLRHG
jgi:hypothetical protein